MLAMLLLFGCAGTPEEKPAEKPASDDSEVKLIVGENYTLGEPIAFQLKTTNYSISFLNRSGGYSIGSYPSLWICRKIDSESCENIEYRTMKDFSTCESGVVNVWAPDEAHEKRDVFPAESYLLLLHWEQTDWKEVKAPCGSSFSVARRAQEVGRGEYSVTFVYWVSWDGGPRSVSADFRII